jgi:hypothetical protein
MVRIQLENGFLDVKEGTVFPLNFAVGDIRDLTKRSGAFSKTITLVGSKNNHELLNHYYDVNISAGTFNINALTKCSVIQNGVPIMEDALLQLLSVNKNQQTDAYEQAVEYEVLIKDTRVEFFTAIANKELTDLDFTDLNHTFSAADIVATFDNTITDGFKYVLPYDTDNLYNVRQMKPAIYAKTYFDRIFATAGFQYEWSDLASARFDKLLIPYNGDSNTFDAADYLVEEENSTPLTASVASTSANNYREDVTGWTEITDVQGSFNPTTGEFTVPISTNAAAGEAYIMEYQINFEFQIDNTNATVVLNSLSPFKATPVIGFSILGYNGQFSNLSPEQVINQGSIIPVGVTSLTGGIVTGSVALLSDGTLPAFLTSGQVANVVVGWQNGYCQFTGALPVNVELIVNSVRIKITPTSNVQVIGGILDINQYVPLKIKQSDYIKSIFQMYNLYADTDTDQPNKLILRHRDEYYDSGEEKDWSAKLMKDREQNLIFLPDLTAKKLKLTYKADKDSPNEVYTQMTDEIYGQLEYTFENEYVRDTETKELIFSPTPVVATSFDAYVPSLNGEAPKTNIRILYDGGEQSCGSWDLIEYGTTGELGITTYPMLGHFDDALTPTFDINFATCDYYYYTPSTLTANNLYNLYWRRTVNQINVGKMLVAYFHLNEADIQTLKLNDKIRIDNSWWNINKVIDYDANAEVPTKVELISIDTEIDLAPFVTNPGAPVSPPITAASHSTNLTTRSTEANVNLSGLDVIVRGTGNNIGDGLRGLVIGDNRTLQEDGIITPRINGAIAVAQTYVALLTQSGTAAPTAVVLADNIGDITWSRISAGEYLGRPTTPFNSLNTFVIIGNVEHDYLASAYVNSDGDIVVSTCRTTGGGGGHSHQDDKLLNSPIEVRIYG